jgi:hypothetical protein
MKRKETKNSSCCPELSGLIQHLKVEGLVFLLALLFSSCQKNIDVKIPDYVQKLVVEGKIDNGDHPQVYLSYTVPYFGNHTQSLSEFAVKGAFVTVTDGFTTDTLRDPFGQGYTYLASNMIGIEGRTYNLTIHLNGKTYTAQTTIYPQVKLDSLWFKPTLDSLGFIWARMTEPATPGDHYRWFAKRIGKDQTFLAPLGSAFDDKFINGKTFDFAYDRAVLQGSTAADDNNIERGYFKRGDQVVVKFCTIGEKEFLFFRSYDANIVSNGNPFAAPSNLQSNINGENVLGVWCGYNPYFDTVICK